MITIPDIKKEIQLIKGRIEEEDLKPATEKRLRNKIPFYNSLIHYLETGPSEDFIKSEINRIETRISKIMLLFDEKQYLNVSNKDFAAIKKSFEKMHDIPKLKEQLNVLKFLI